MTTHLRTFAQVALLVLSPVAARAGSVGRVPSVPGPLSQAGLGPRVFGANAGPEYGRSITTLGDMTGDGLSELAVGAPMETTTVAAAGAVHVLYNTPNHDRAPTVLSGDESNDLFGNSIAGVGDVNGDGYPDLLVGSPLSTIGGHAQAGKALLYLGGPSGIATTPAWTFSTGETGAEVGYSVAWAGDLNGDGYNDWIVGAPTHRDSSSVNVGAVYVFYGGPNGLSTTPAWSYSPTGGAADAGFSVSGAGDVNGDGYDDLIVGAPLATGTFTSEGAVHLFLGHASGPSPAPDRTWYGGQAGADLGFSVADAGDVNGDGYADMIFGEPYYTDIAAHEGRALVVHGGPFPPLYATPLILEQHVASGYFGLSVGTAGDTNGDGIADILVGMPGIAEGAAFGEAFLYLGSTQDLDPYTSDTLKSTIAGETAGVSVGTMGDVNGDGFSDYWTGAPGSISPGETVSRTVPPFDGSLVSTLAGQGGVAGRHFGNGMAVADVNGDGYDDLIAGTSEGGTNVDDGYLAVYLGGPEPFPALNTPPYTAPAPAWTYSPPGGGSYLGYSLADAGDVNGDGYEDFVTGGPYFNTGTLDSAGTAYVFYGSHGGPVSARPWIITGDAANAHLGIGVGGGGDLNGDGFADVVVGEDGGAKSVAGEGIVKVFHGGPLGLSRQPTVVLGVGESGARFGASCAILGDVNGDGYDDLAVGAPLAAVGELQYGKVYIYFGSPTGVHDPPSQTLVGTLGGGLFGSCVARAGDLTGDGYADLVVGQPGTSQAAEASGGIQVFYGSASGLVGGSGYAEAQAGEQLGGPGTLGAAGDLNYDGIGDLLVGAPQWSGSGGSAGIVRAFQGSSSVVYPSPFFSVSFALPSGRLGASVAGEADFNGDGFDDIAFSQPGQDAGFGAGEGAVYAYMGNRWGPSKWNAPRGLTAWRADDTAPIGFGLRSDSQTSFRLHGAGHSPAGRTRMALEWEAKPVGTAFAVSGHGMSPWQLSGSPSGGNGSVAPWDVTVAGLVEATAYHWRARVVSPAPQFAVSPWFGSRRRSPTERQLFTAGAPGVVGVPPASGSLEVALAPAIPNPSREAATSFAFTLPSPGRAQLAIYDLRGAHVRTLFEGAAPAGRTTATWDGKDESGRRVAVGAYFARLTALGKEAAEKLVRL